MLICQGYLAQQNRYDWVLLIPVTSGLQSTNFGNGLTLYLALLYIVDIGISGLWFQIHLLKWGVSCDNQNQKQDLQFFRYYFFCLFTHLNTLILCAWRWSSDWYWRYLGCFSVHSILMCLGRGFTPHRLDHQTLFCCLLLNP